MATGYTSALAADLAPELLERFTRYVRIDTQARRDRAACPSSPGQLELARMLAEELRIARLEAVVVDAHGYVTATLSGSRDDLPVIGLLAHMDTSPDAPGAGVEPIVHRAWDGSVIELPRRGTRLDPATVPGLAERAGHDIVTASGDTLLGADDKAGVAEIVAAVAHLAAHPDLPRPTLRICFTPDEEIGEGATLFDVAGFGAECAYTLDGSEVGEISDESFSAEEAVVTVTGIDVHPGSANGILVSALRIAAGIVAALPADRLSPETTSGRDGFLHPFALSGSSASAEIRLIARDFDDRRLREHVGLLRAVCAEAERSHPGATVRVEVREQYRNMRQYIDRVPHVTAAAEKAIRAEGLEPVRKPIRGGTDGSRLSEMGLPTPNLFTGGHEYHSVREWASLQDMAAAAATIVRLAAVWAEPGMGELAVAAR